jgi:hypothetical protein
MVVADGTGVIVDGTTVAVSVLTAGVQEAKISTIEITHDIFLFILIPVLCTGRANGCASAARGAKRSVSAGSAC